MADDITHYDAVEGYVFPTSVAQGDVAQLRVSTSAASFDVSVERWGATREPVWSASGVAGVEQATPADADAAGCGWRTVVEIATDPGWSSGFYLVTLTAHDAPADRAVSHAGFVVRPATRSSDVLFVLATNTWNAYNNWGGKSLYTGGHAVSFDRPWGRGMLVRPEVADVDRKSPPRQPGAEPDIDGDAYQAFRYEHGFPGYMGSAGWYTYDRRFVEWAEGAGHQLDYAISSDLDDPGAVDGYALVIGAGHDEYWSAPARDTVEGFVAGGGNYASFSGNTMFWQVRIDESGRTMTCHKYGAVEHDPLTTDQPHRMSGMWCDPLVGRPERRFLGAASMYGLYSRFGRATPHGVQGFVVYRPDHWLLEGTDLVYGDVLGHDAAVLGYETVGTRYALDDVNLPVAVVDPALAGDALPDEVEIVALTPVSNLAMGDYPKSIAALDDQGDLEFVAERVYGGTPDGIAKVRHGNAVVLTCRPAGAHGGRVVTVGSTDWVFGLARDRRVARVTDNVVRRLGAAADQPG